MGPASAEDSPAQWRPLGQAAASPWTEQSAQHERDRRFGDALQALKARVDASLGEEDVAHVKRIRRWSNAFEAAGRLLIHLSLEPLSFLLGVVLLAIHQQLETTEIGHTALHGAYDGLPGAEAFRSEDFAWRDVPIDEESWKHGHNLRHHPYTNVTDRDGDIHVGPVRLNTRTPRRAFHAYQVPWLLAEAGFFCVGMNLHFTGVNDTRADNGRGGLDFLPDRSAPSVRAAWRRALRKLGPYTFKNYVFFPALAGLSFWKVMLGNFLASTLRDLYSAATIYCGHVGDDVADYPVGARAHGRGEWFRMQVEATNNFEVPYALSLLCGGLDTHIEHHLFPTLPPNRLREIAPEVRRVCEAHGVTYRSAPWPTVLRRVLRRLLALGRPDAR
ncbi:MAG: fatty acid desaturase [Myxococcaceae bacterium]|nr:fatty acid desaturase [Myxococcaceae bacterium]